MTNERKKNSVFIATSIDGYIADKNGGLEWLNSVPNPDQIDVGYDLFIEHIDAIVMGRKTFETVCNFGIDWPYTKPVFVLSRTLEKIPEKYRNYAELAKGSTAEILHAINQRGYYHLYIDGGATIQSFLREDLIDELVITTIPVLLGGGVPLFSYLTEALMFKLVRSTVYLDEIVQNHYIRNKI